MLNYFMEKLEKEKLYKALLSRDARYDGRFYYGVTTTGIYCRPICIAKPKIQNVEIYKSKSEAEKAGFRACLRCKPDLSPSSPQWNGTAAIMNRALNLVIDGDLEGMDLKIISDKLGMTDRHLRRLFNEHIGVSPLEFAISNRLHLARQLLSQTKLSIINIAHASGFGSLRRFNDAFLKTYKKKPRDYRNEINSSCEVSDYLTIELPYIPPFDWNHFLNYLKNHEIFGVEITDENSYARHFKTSHGLNYFQVTHLKKSSSIKIALKMHSHLDLRAVIEKIRSQFDLAHNPNQIDFISKNKHSGIILKQLQEVRVPHAFDPFEVAIMTILGQLVSTKQARQNIKKLVLKYGKEINNPFHPGLTHLFPTPGILMKADFAGLGFTQARGSSIRELSKMIYNNEIDLSKTCDLELTKKQLLSIKGIGPWTVEMIALRCLNDSDAFPRKDLIIARVLVKLKIDDQQLAPWRAYLALAIWKKHI